MTRHDPNADDAGADPAWAPADPPSGPEPVPSTTVAAGMVVAVGLAVLDVTTRGAVGHLLNALSGPPAPAPLPTTIEGTSAPAVHRDGTIACTRCHAAAAYETMSLDEHGYFCPRCGPSQPR